MKLAGFVTVIMTILMIVTCGRQNDPHAHGEPHGPPKDWKFTLTKGSAEAGREIFMELECYKCHEVKGENFPDTAPGEKGVGPELSHMAGMYPLEFFAESILNPNAVIDDDAKEEGHVGQDGRSKMPDYADVLTVKQLADLSTYLASLKGQVGKAQH